MRVHKPQSSLEADDSPHHAGHAALEPNAARWRRHGWHVHEPSAGARDPASAAAADGPGASAPKH